jgi:hypothetical protein
LRDQVLELPAELDEVSAVVVHGAHEAACVQDEAGALWLVDLATAGAPRVVPFGPAGDYEGLARVGDSWWVLRSDGLVCELAAAGGALHIARRVTLPGPYRDWEGLCYDGEGQRLLVMPKDAPGDKAARDQRVVFAIDPATAVVQAEPVVRFLRSACLDAAWTAGLDVPTRRSGSGSERVDAELVCSDLVVVPGRRELLLLCAADALLVRIDFAGRPLGARRLDAGLLPQAEGLAWLPDGRLLVASEAKRGPARLVVVPPP